MQSNFQNPFNNCRIVLNFELNEKYFYKLLTNMREKVKLFRKKIQQITNFCMVIFFAKFNVIQKTNLFFLKIKIEREGEDERKDKTINEICKELLLSSSSSSFIFHFYYPSFSFIESFVIFI